MAGPFSEDVVVERVGAGRYAAAVDHSWDVAALPQGGIVAAFGLRASTLEAGQPASALRTCTTVFAGPVTAGELEVDVTVLRSGRTATQVLSTVRNAGAEAGATTLAVFGGSRRGPDFVDVRPPEVGGPDEYLTFAERPPPPDFGPMEARPIWARLDGKPVIGHAPWEQYEATSSDVATWVRLAEPPVEGDGSLDPLAIPVIVDRMPGAVAERQGGARAGGWFAPSIDLTVHFFGTAGPGWLLAHDRARWAHDGWASAESTLWSEDGALLAYATQMMVFAYS